SCCRATYAWARGKSSTLPPRSTARHPNGRQQQPAVLSRYRPWPSRCYPSPAIPLPTSAGTSAQEAADIPGTWELARSTRQEGPRERPTGASKEAASPPLTFKQAAALRLRRHATRREPPTQLDGSRRTPQDDTAATRWSLGRGNALVP